MTIQRAVPQLDPRYPPQVQPKTRSPVFRAIQRAQNKNF